MIVDFVLIIFGFLFLVGGAEALVSGASSLAKKFRISELVIGLTVVAFGTSSPELVVNVIASIDNNEGIVMGNIIGSNIFNILLILGVSGFIRPLKVHRKAVQGEIFFALIAMATIGIAANDFFGNDGPRIITSSEGLLMLVMFALLLAITFWKKAEAVEVELGVKLYPLWMIMALISSGLLILLLGGSMVVNGAVALARDFQVSESIIGLTIVSVGTSLPELATSSVAAIRHRTSMAMGNVLGSNIFNSLFILPISALFRDIPYDNDMSNSWRFLMFVSILLVVSLAYKWRFTLGRKKAIVFLVLYVVYMVYILRNV